MSTVRDREYETALGQAGPFEDPVASTGGVLAGGVAPGEVSPGTLESGGCPGTNHDLSLPIASPFHSERVREEVALRRQRPINLDVEAVRLGVEVDESALGDPSAGGSFLPEPDYTASFGPDDAPRVARVEPASEGDLGAVEVGFQTVRVESPSATGKGRGTPSKNTRSEFQGQGMEEMSQVVASDDSRELIPEGESRLHRVESLLAQVMEENKFLKARLQTESHSSWHSQRTAIGEGTGTCSPASFARGHEHFNVAAALGVQSGQPSSFPEFPEVLRNTGQGAELVDSRFGLFPGQQSALLRASSQQASLTRPPNLSEWHTQVDFGSIGALGAGGFASVSGGESTRHLPLPPPTGAVPRVADAPAPVTMLKFAAEVSGGGLSVRDESGYVTPRAGEVSYPVSPGGTVIRPPPGPPPASPRMIADRMPMDLGSAGLGGFRDVPIAGMGDTVRPEEPAKYINDLPKLNQTELSQSAVVCGNWLAQVRQIMVGLSTSAGVWWQGVEGPATAAYRRWLVADPLGRLSIDPSTVKGDFDFRLYGRVESRAVSLLLASVPQSVRDDVVTNRWLTSAAILFRVLCIFQPGGSSERSHLLSQLVSPEACKSFGDAIKILRKWQQGLQRAAEIHATLPDASLLLRGVDNATSGLLTANPMIGFRVNAFRHQLAIDYNPTVTAVMQLVKLIQAECEVASITSEGVGDKRARTAVLSA